MMTPSQEFRLATILVAESDPKLLCFICDVLRREHYRVIAADQGGQALDILLGQQIDMALLGVELPAWNGFSLCSVVKSNPLTRLTPVILITDPGAMPEQIHGMECGADAFLSEPVQKEELLARVRSLLRMKRLSDESETSEQALFSLALSVEARDPYTRWHCERLMRYSAAVADHFVMPESERAALRRAAMLHDIGKVALPDAILLKPGPLTIGERTVMQQHPLVGERICSSLASFRGALPIVRSHHERMDGTGYPDGLKGDQIPLAARILSLADVYDALTSDRPFRKALSRKAAIETMHREASNGWLDPSLLEIFEFRSPHLPQQAISIQSAMTN